MEAEAARWIKPTVQTCCRVIAGQTAPRRLWHAGAIVGGAEDTAAAKMKLCELFARCC